MEFAAGASERDQSPFDDEEAIPSESNATKTQPFEYGNIILKNQNLANKATTLTPNLSGKSPKMMSIGNMLA